MDNWIGKQVSIIREEVRGSSSYPYEAMGILRQVTEYGIVWEHHVSGNVFIPWNRIYMVKGLTSGEETTQE